MVNPILNGANWFLAVFNALPLPFRSFIFLALGLFVIVAIVRMILV